MLRRRFDVLTHWPRDHKADISQTTISNAYFFNKKYIFIKIWLEFVPRDRIDNRLVSFWREAIIWTNAGIVHRHIRTSPGLNIDQLNKPCFPGIQK